MISLSDILTELVLKPSRKFYTLLLIFAWQEIAAQTRLYDIIIIFLFAGYSKKSSSSSDVENTGTIPEETGSDDEIELATKAELLDQPLTACEDIAMMDDDEESSRLLRNALNGVTMTETNNSAVVSHQLEMPTAVGEWCAFMFISHIAAFVHISFLVVDGCQVRCFIMSRNCGGMSFHAWALWFPTKPPIADAVYPQPPCSLTVCWNLLRDFGTLLLLFQQKQRRILYLYGIYTRSRRASSDIEWKQSSVLIWCKLISSSSLYLFYFDFSSCCHTLSISSIFERASIALQLSEKNSVWFISWRVNNCVYPSLTQCSLGLLSNHYVLFQVLVHMNEQMELKKKKSGDLKYRKW